MKTKNVWMPILAFVVAIGMAFATTPINAFQTEVWRATGPADCHKSDCMPKGDVLCDDAFLYYDEQTCTTPPIDAYEPQ